MRRRFQIFNDNGGKFRVAVTNVCNLNCFFCHNEAMPNPRAGAQTEIRLHTAELAAIINAFTALGGRQVNLTGGEPLASDQLLELVGSIDKRSTRVMLNTNAALANRLLDHPRVEAIDGILASLHTVDQVQFRERLGGRSVSAVMQNIVALRDHGYDVEINFSLGDYNKDEFDRVLDFAVSNRIALKAIAFVRVSDDAGFYRGDWIDPGFIDERLKAREAKVVGGSDAFGGQTTTWSVDSVRVKVKNIARGRLVTDFCDQCSHHARCGEGIYGLRVGVDGVWKPCLLRRDRFKPVTSADYEAQILRTIDQMIGHWPNAWYRTGAPD